MSEYIKKEDVENIMLSSWGESALWKLRYLPAADVVEVVRCKDCMYKNECEKIVVFDIHVDSVQGHRVDFCSYGEREGQENGNSTDN